MSNYICDVFCLPLAVPQFEPLLSSNTVSIGISERPQIGTDSLVKSALARHRLLATGHAKETSIQLLDTTQNYRSDLIARYFDKSPPPLQEMR